MTDVVSTSSYKRLRPVISPRVLRRMEAAAYLGVSPGSFDTMVKDGTVPQPKVMTPNIVGWDVADLDAFVDSLPYRDGSLESKSDPSEPSSELDRMLKIA